MGDRVDQTMGGHGCWTEGFVLHFVLDVGNPGRVSEQRLNTHTHHCTPKFEPDNRILHNLKSH